MNRESHDSKAIQTSHGVIQDIKRYINRYVSCKVIFETNRDTYRTIHTILTTMVITIKSPVKTLFPTAQYKEIRGRGVLEKINSTQESKK